MSSQERSPTTSPSAEETSTSYSSSGYQSTPANPLLDDEFVIVDLEDEPCVGPAPVRRWSCSLPRVRFHSSSPEEGVDIAMGESGLAADQPLTVAEQMQRTVVRVPRHVALRYKTGDTWSEVTYRDYYYQCITAAKSFIKVRQACMRVAG